VPIRTNRGRAAVYRRLWGWPLRSPKHLVITGLLVAVISGGLGFLLPEILGQRQAQPTAASSSATTTRSPWLGQNKDTGGGQPATTATRLSPVDSRTSAPPDPAGLDVATKWGAAWVKNQGVNKEQWLAGLAPYTTEEYLRAKMATVEIANIRATAVTGPATATASYAGSLTVTLPTNGPKLSLTLIKTADGWRVAGYDEAV
jgi:hypothetical protein